VIDWGDGTPMSAGTVAQAGGLFYVNGTHTYADSLVNGGNPVGKSWTVRGNGSVTKDGGPNPVSGYSLVEAKDYEAAAALAGGCPLLVDGGSVEVAQVMDM